MDASKKNPSPDKKSKFFKSVKNNDINGVNAYIQAGYDVNIQMKSLQSYSALMLAAHLSNVAIIQILLAAGADRNLTSSNGETALDLCTTPECTALLSIATTLPPVLPPPKMDEIVSPNAASPIDYTKFQELKKIEKEELLGVEFKEDVSRYVFRNDDANLWVYNVTTGSKVRLAWYDDGIGVFRFSDDGTRLVGAFQNKNIGVWDADTGEELHILKGHTSHVTSVTFDPDGKYIASGSSDKTVRIWNATTGATLFVLKGHTGDVNAVAFNHDGTLVASTSDDASVCIWDWNNGVKKYELTQHKDMIKCVAFNSDGTQLVSGSYDEIRVFDVETGTQMIKIKASNDVTAVAFNSDGTRIISASIDEMKIWDAATGTEIIKIDSPGTGSIDEVAFNQDGTKIMYFSLEDNTIGVWGIPLSEKALPITLPALVPITPVDYTKFQELKVTKKEGLLGVEFKQNVSRYVFDGDNDLQVHNVATGKDLLLNNEHEAAPMSGFQFNEDGTRLVGAFLNKTIGVWNANTGEQLQTLKGHTGNVYSVTIDRKGKLIASGSYDKTVRIWNATTGETLFVFKGHTAAVNVVTFNRDGTLVASASDDKSVRIWDTTTGAQKHSLEGWHNEKVSCVAFSPDGTQLASGSSDETIRIFDVETGTQMIQINAPDYVMALAFNSDGTRIISASGLIASGGKINIRDATTGIDSIGIDVEFDVDEVLFNQDGTKIMYFGHEYDTIGVWGIPSHSNAIVPVAIPKAVKAPVDYTALVLMKTFEVKKTERAAFSPDGKQVACGPINGNIAIFDVSTENILMTLKANLFGYNALYSLAFSPDGKQIACGGANVVYVWDVKTGDGIMDVKTTGDVYTLSFNPNGDRIVIGGMNEDVNVYDVNTGSKLMEISGHKDTVRAVAFSPDGTRIVSSGNNDTICVWDVKTQKRILKIDGYTASCIAWSQDGTKIVSGGAEDDHKVRIWNAITGKKINTLKGHTQTVFSLAFNFDATRIVSGDIGGAIHVWDTQSGNDLNELNTSSDDWVLALSFSVDGTQIMSVYDEVVSVWGIPAVAAVPATAAVAVAVAPQPSSANVMKQLKAESEAYLKDLSPESRAIVVKYTGASYKGMNKCLRKSDGAKDPICDEELTELDRVLVNGPKTTVPIVLYRGFDPSDAGGEDLRKLIEALKPGETFEERAFMSTAYEKVTERFVGSKCCVLQIEVPAGVNVLVVEKVSQYPDEHEVLLSPGMGLELTKTSLDAKGRKVYHFDCKYCLPSRRFRSSIAPTSLLNVRTYRGEKSNAADRIQLPPVLGGIVRLVMVKLQPNQKIEQVADRTGAKPTNIFVPGVAADVQEQLGIAPIIDVVDINMIDEYEDTQPMFFRTTQPLTDDDKVKLQEQKFKLISTYPFTWYQRGTHVLQTYTPDANTLIVDFLRTDSKLRPSMRKMDQEVAASPSAKKLYGIVRNPADLEKVLGCPLFSQGCVDELKNYETNKTYPVNDPKLRQFIAMIKHMLSSLVGKMVILPVLRDTKVKYVISGTTAINYWIRTVGSGKSYELPIIPTEDYDIKLNMKDAQALANELTNHLTAANIEELRIKLSNTIGLEITTLRFDWNGSTQTLYRSIAKIGIPRLAAATGGKETELMFPIIEFSGHTGMNRVEDKRIRIPNGLYMVTPEYIRDDLCKGWGQKYKAKRREAKMLYWNMVFPKGHRLHQSRPFSLTATDKC